MPNEALPIDLDALLAIDAKRTPGKWETGGPYPSTSVIICVDGGCGWLNPEPPAYECVALIDRRTEGEPHPQALADADAIVSAVNALRPLVERCLKLESQVFAMARWLLAEKKRTKSAARVAEIDKLLDGSAGESYLRDLFERCQRAEEENRWLKSKHYHSLVFELTRQRDELLAAVRYAADYACQIGDPGFSRQIEQIAKLKGAADGA